ncbi:hypothetical protein BJ912DRAFT_1059333 [Pholiota molesta]|nr:hypothetical protein BJ912DRAFT_1059333 [Pholiota molesta]
MSILESRELPLELIEKIIDEAFYSQPSTNTQCERMMAVESLSSLARVSHVFRQRVNAHRFSIVSFHRRGLTPLRFIHAFRDLLQSESDVWLAPSMGIARHVRKLVVILGEYIAMDGATVPHWALADGSLSTIMNIVFRFRGGDGDAYSTGDYTLALWGFAGEQCSNWNVVKPEFMSTLEDLLDTRIARLELKWLSNIPPTLLKGWHVKHISMSNISFQWTLNSQNVLEYTALGPWHHLESLDILRTPAFFDLVAPGDIPNDSPC